MARPPSNHVCKVIMAVTGTIFAGFVVIHMIGNLKVYQGAAAFNHYASWLREVGYPLVPRLGVLWTLRIVLAVSLVAHVGCGLLLWVRARSARGGVRQRVRRPRAVLSAAMAPTGLLLAAFVVVHLLDLTTGHLGAVGFRHPDDAGFHAYGNLIASFARPAYAAFYVAVMVALGAHLSHGLWSVLHDFGGTAPRLRRVWGALAAAVALVVVAVNASIPVAVQAGWLA